MQYEVVGFSLTGWEEDISLIQMGLSFEKRRLCFS